MAPPKMVLRPPPSTRLTCRMQYGVRQEKVIYRVRPQSATYPNSKHDDTGSRSIVSRLSIEIQLQHQRPKVPLMRRHRRFLSTVRLLWHARQEQRVDQHSVARIDVRSHGSVGNDAGTRASAFGVEVGESDDFAAGAEVAHPLIASDRRALWTSKEINAVGSSRHRVFFTEVAFGAVASFW